MVEELGSILHNGFDTWKKNLTICLPFVFSFILTSIVAVIIIGGAILVTVGPLLPSLVPYLTDSGEIPPEVMQQLLPQFLQHIDVIIAAVIITIILVLLINAFFTAGAIGMAKAATEKGRTSLSEMIDYGRRKFSSLLFATLIVGLIALAGVIFLVPGVISLLPAITETPPGVPNMAAFAPLFLGFVVLLFYMLIVSIILALPPYAVVIDDLGAIEGVKRGFKYFMAHKLEVFLLWLILLLIAIVAGIISGTIPYIGYWVNLLVSVIVVQPLSALWWSRLYLSMREPSGL
ncbi:MAG: hypothetical protein IBX41_05300 [Methanophagales archaeon]|nr:hypothetical protein [Methanophagales archaeon]